MGQLISHFCLIFVRILTCFFLFHPFVVCTVRFLLKSLKHRHRINFNMKLSGFVQLMSCWSDKSILFDLTGTDISVVSWKLFDNHTNLSPTRVCFCLQGHLMDGVWPCWRYVGAGQRVSVCRGTMSDQQIPATKGCVRDWQMLCLSPPQEI